MCLENMLLIVSFLFSDVSQFALKFAFRKMNKLHTSDIQWIACTFTSYELHELHSSHLFLNSILKPWYFASKCWNHVRKLWFSIKSTNQPIVYTLNTGFVQENHFKVAYLCWCHRQITKRLPLHQYSQNISEITTFFKILFFTNLVS